MHKTASRLLQTALLPAVFALTLALAPSRVHAQFVFEQNDNGQTFQDTDGLTHTFPNNNLWTQAYTTYTDSHGHTFDASYTNWTTKTTFPNGAGVGVTVGGSCHLDESVSFQNLDVTTSGVLAIDSSNSGGGGNHAITVTMAAGGAGTLQNDGGVSITGTDQNMTVALVNNLTLTGDNSFLLQNGTVSIQGPGALINAIGHTITAGGNPTISAPLANAGLIDAGGLTITSPTATNTGTILSAGGNSLPLYLSGVNFNNTGGAITIANAGSLVDVGGGTTLTGGTLTGATTVTSSTGTGFFYNDGTITLANVLLAAGSAFRGDNPITLAGTLTNDGTFNCGGFNFSTENYGGFLLAADATVAGTGTVNFAAASKVAPVTASANPLPVLTNAAGHTLAGGGAFTLDLNNQGLLDANANGSTLTLGGSANRNTGTMEATGGGTLVLGGGGTLDNTGGIITTDVTGRVDLTGVTVKGGTLGSVNDTGTDLGPGNYGPGTVYNDAESTLQDVTLAAGGVFSVLNPLDLVGTFTNNGYVHQGGFNFSTLNSGTLNAATDVAINGTGTVVLSTIQATNNATYTLGTGGTVEKANGTIAGAGTVSASLVNNGTVDGTYNTLTISGPAFTNNRFLSADNNATVSVSGSTAFTNFNAATGTLTGGTYRATDTGNGATLDFSGRNVLVNAASIILNGPNASFSAVNGLTDNQGSFSVLGLKQFSNTGSLSNEGTLTLGAGGTFHTGGGYTGSAASTLAFVIGGTAASGASSPGVLQVNGGATVAGALVLSFATGATLPAATDTLTVLSSTAPLAGSFANVASGGRINTSDNLGSFEVDYGPGSAAPDNVTLSHFGPVVAATPTPTPTATPTPTVTPTPTPTPAPTATPTPAPTATPTPTPTVSPTPVPVPVITVAASVGRTHLGSGTPAQVVVTRAGAGTDLTRKLVVRYTLKGSAINGEDYALLPGKVKIKPGRASAVIDVAAQGRLLGADPKTVKVVIQPEAGGAYTVGSPDIAKVKLFR